MAVPQSRPVFPAGEAQIPAPSANLTSGAVLNHAAYGPCVVEGLLPNQTSGGLITIRHSKGPTIALPSASATTFAANAEVEWHDATDLAVAATAGTFDVGRAAFAKTSGQLEVLVILGE